MDIWIIVLVQTITILIGILCYLIGDYLACKIMKLLFGSDNYIVTLFIAILIAFGLLLLVKLGLSELTDYLIEIKGLE